MQTEENTNETETTTPETTEAAEAPQSAAEAAPEIPGSLGSLTPEEHQALLSVRQESQQLLAKVGEHEVLKMRLLAKLDELEQRGQGYINAVSARLGLKDGEQWVALQDGTLRLVNPPPAPQGEPEGGADAS